MDLTFTPDFNVDNIVKVVRLFYPTEENLSEAASMYLKLDSVYPENGTTAFNAKQRYEKWKVVISGTCQSLYWEIL
jgi:squalene cyclase